MEPPECALPATKRVRPAAPPPLRAPLQAAAGEDAQDRLSALDDGTLHAILARVPLRDAAATTTLSRRWPRVFAMLPRLLLRAATFSPTRATRTTARTPGAGWTPSAACSTAAPRRSPPSTSTSSTWACTMTTSPASSPTSAAAVASSSSASSTASTASATICPRRSTGAPRSPPSTSASNRHLHVDYSYSEIEEMHDYEKMAEREHKRTDEIGNLVTFLSGLGCAKKLYLAPKIPEFLSRGKVSMPKVLPKKRCLFGLEKLVLALDHNHEVFATLVSCLLNSSPNLKDLIISDSQKRHVPLPLQYWKEQIDADGVLNHLSSVTFFIDSILEGHPCGGFCQFLVPNARVLKRISIMYYRREVKTEDAPKLEAIREEIQLWPRAFPDLRLELCPLNHHPSFNLDSD